MKCRFLILMSAAILLLSARHTTAQITVEGTVRDEATNTPIEDARITVLRAANFDTLASGVRTDAEGRFRIEVELATGVDPGPTAAENRYWVGSAHPNPAAAGVVRIPFGAPGGLSAQPDVELFDVLGRSIQPGTQLSAGVYFYRLRFGDEHLSTARSLVLAEAGVLKIEPTPSVAPSTIHVATANSTPTLQIGLAAVERRVLVQVRRSGFRSEEVLLDLVPQTENRVDFELTPVGALSARFEISGDLIAGSPVAFDASSSEGDVRTFSWEFGDGKRGGGQRVAHIFTSAGTYTATLVVADHAGSREIATREISISAPPQSSGSARLTGFLADRNRDPLEEVTASLVGSGVRIQSDALGMIVLENVPTGVPVIIRLEKPGFATGFARLELPPDAQKAQFEAVLLGGGSTNTLARAEDGGFTSGPSGASIQLFPGSLIDSQGRPATGSAEVGITPLDVSDPVEIEAFPGSFRGLEGDGGEVRLGTLGVADYTITQSDGSTLQLTPGSFAVIEIPLYTDVDEEGQPLEIGDTLPIWSLDPETGIWTEEGRGRVVSSEASPTGFALRAEVTHLSWWNCDVSLLTALIKLAFTLANGPKTISLPDEVVAGAAVDVRAITSSGVPRFAEAVDYFPLGQPAELIIPLDTGPVRFICVFDPNPDDLPPDENLVGEITIDPQTTPISSGDSFDVVLEPRVRAIANGCEKLVAGRRIRRGVEIVGDVDCFTFEGEEDDFALFRFSDVQILTAFVGNIWLASPSGIAIWQQQFGQGGTSRRIQLPETGTYRLLVGGQGVSRGTYLLEFNLEGNCGFGEELDLPSSTLCNVETTDDVDTFSFEAEVGQTALIEACSYDFGNQIVQGEIELTAAQGGPFASTSFAQACGRLSTPLPGAGSYSVRVRATAGTGPYRLWVETAPLIAVNTEFTGTLEVPFTTDRLTFSLPNPAEVVIGTVNETVGHFLLMRLIDQQGTALQQATVIADGTAEIRRSLPAGIYVLEQDPSDNRTGTYRTVVRTLPAVQDAPIDTFVDISIDDAFSINRQRISLPAAETIVVGVKNLSVGNFLSAVLFDSGGRRIESATATANSIAEIRVYLEAGNYVLELDPHGERTGEVSFIVRTIAPPSAASVDVLIDDSVAEEFAYDRFTIDVPEAGTYVLGTINETIGNFLSSRLFGPDGRLVNQTTAAANTTSEIEAALSAGPHRVEIDPSGDLTGDYAFVLRKIAPPEAVAPGNSVESEIAEPFAYDSYAFSLAAAATITVETTNIDVGNFLATQIHDGSGVRRGQAVSSDGQNSTLTLSLPAGDYTLVQNPSGALTGRYAFILEVE